ncbi:MAG: dihydropteroate synthase [Nitrospinales bacterium]
MPDFSLNVNGESMPVLIMGILNLSPDSFYKESHRSAKAESLALAERLVEEGADILDIGAETSRPGSQPIADEVELDRLMAVVPELRRRIKIPLSVDTRKPRVAEKMLSLGVDIINDITGLQGRPEMAKTIARHGAGVVLMHMRGTPATMQNRLHYDDLIGEILLYLRKSVALAEDAGIRSDRIAIDPGIGFGKTAEHNLEILRQLDRFKVLNKPILLGASRKSFIGEVLGLPTEERLEGSLASALIGMENGASILRVHDVKETVRAVKMARAILNPRAPHDSGKTLHQR